MVAMDQRNDIHMPIEVRSKAIRAAHLESSRSLLENDSDDYADRIFNYLGEAYANQVATVLPAKEVQAATPPTLSLPTINPSDKEIKPLLCAFCPYVARNIHEFQIHIAKHTEKNFRCSLCNCM